MTKIACYFSQTIADCLAHAEHLKKVLQGVTFEKSTDTSIYHTLYAAFAPHPEGELPFAALAGLADGLPTQTGWWLRLDPVEFEADQTDLRLLGNQQLALSFEETQALINLLNQHFMTDGYQLWAPKTDTWYLQSQIVSDIQTIPLLAVLQRSIRPTMLMGTDKIHWHRLWLEMQMLLAQSSVNQTRLRLGKPAINGVWLWGAGVLPRMTANTVTSVYGDEAILRGLATVTQIPITTTFLPSPYYVVFMNDLFAIEEKLARPLWKWINKFHQEIELSFYFIDGYREKLSSKTFLSWWKKIWY